MSCARQRGPPGVHIDTSPADAEVRALLTAWVHAVQRGELAGVRAHHPADVVMFDVPPPFQGVRGIEAYERTWPGFFEWLASGAVFELESLQVTAGDDVAFAWALLRCGRPEELAERPDLRLRITFGLRRDDDGWSIAHEHHSFPAVD
jgi:uncharacterized protein (TIGR02246 family)